MDTNVLITVNGRESSFIDLKQDFEHQGITLPDEEWQGEFTKKQRERAREKEREGRDGLSFKRIADETSQQRGTELGFAHALAKKTSPNKKDGN